MLSIGERTSNSPEQQADITFKVCSISKSLPQEPRHCVPAFIMGDRKELRFHTEDLYQALSEEQQSEFQDLKEAFYELNSYKKGAYLFKTTATGLATSGSIVPGWMIILSSYKGALKIPPNPQALIITTLGAITAFIPPFILATLLSQRANDNYLLQVKQFLDHSKKLDLSPKLKEDIYKYHDLAHLYKLAPSLINTKPTDLKYIDSLPHLLKDLGRYLQNTDVIEQSTHPKKTSSLKYCLPGKRLRNDQPNCFKI